MVKDGNVDARTLSSSPQPRLTFPTKSPLKRSVSQKQGQWTPSRRMLNLRNNSIVALHNHIFYHSRQHLHYVQQDRY